MAEDESFQRFLGRLRAGNGDAALAVFRRFTRRLMALARTRIEMIPTAAADVEDVIQSAYRSFFTRVREGEFQLQSWEGLWSLLSVITLRKCANRREFYLAKRRDVRRNVLPSGSHSDWAVELAERMVDREPTPLEAATLSDLVETLFRGLEPADRETVRMLLQGYTAEEIAMAQTCSERTVRRVRARLKERLRRLYLEEETRRPA